MLLVLCAVQAWLLLRQGALLPAAMVLIGAAGVGWGGWILLADGGARDECRLRLYPDGSVVLVMAGNTARARVAPCSQRLGRHVLLVLRTGGRRPVRLLLGPANLAPEQLAALGRWLPLASAGEGTGSKVLG